MDCSEKVVVIDCCDIVIITYYCCDLINEFDSLQTALEIEELKQVSILLLSTLDIDK